jgi:hypothetical protein
MNKSVVAKLSIRVCVVSVVLISGVFACAPKFKVGTVTQASQAKADVAQGLSRLAMVKMDIAAVLSSFRDVVPAQLLIQVPSNTTPVIPVTRIQLNPYYGTYNESSPGQFDFLPVVAGGGHFKVEYLNGVTADFTVARFNSREMVEYITLTVRSNTRGIDTPAAEEVDISLSLKYIDKPDHITTMNSARSEIMGHIAYLDSMGQHVKYDVQQYSERSTRPASQNSVLLLTVEDKLVIYDKTNAPIAPPMWLSINKKNYVQSSVAGVWAAILMSMTYKDADVSYVANANFDPAGVTPMGASGVVSYSGQGLVLFQNRYKVATIQGGLHECSLSKSSNPDGSGIPLVVEWVDAGSDFFLPSAQLDCTDAVILEADL